MASLTVVAGGSAAARAAAVEERLRGAGAAAVHQTLARDWPFSRRPGEGAPTEGPLVVRAIDLHEAFPAGQSGGTRLVLTQSMWQMQRWLDWMDRRGRVTLVADADGAALRHAAPEAFQGRGPWAAIDLLDLGPDERSEGPGRPEQSHRSDLECAFRTTNPEERLARCRRGADMRPADPVVQTALGSACMEVQDLGAAEAALTAAAAADPDWEAVHFELGKLWLRRDDMDRACAAFAEAGRLMPGFSAAFSNLGATLGELDRPEEALRAFQQAMAFDPTGHAILNNIGVVSRELGRLGESEAAFRRVIALAPEFVFGHYNLGHTLFLRGRYRAALSAYEEGQRRDPQQNARQACRLAVVRLAAGDPDGAMRDLRRVLPALPPDQKREIVDEAQEILWALLTAHPDVPGWRRVSELVATEANR